MLCGWGVKAGMAHSICRGTCRWQVQLCDPLLTPERFRDEQLMAKRYINKASFMLSFKIEPIVK